MENQITCPACRRTITNNPVMDSAAKGDDQAMGVKGSHFGQLQLSYEIRKSLWKES